MNVQTIILMTYQVSRAITTDYNGSKTIKTYSIYILKQLLKVPTMPIKTWRVEDMRANRFDRKHFMEVVDIYEV